MAGRKGVEWVVMLLVLGWCRVKLVVQRPANIRLFGGSIAAYVRSAGETVMEHMVSLNCVSETPIHFRQQALRSRSTHNQSQRNSLFRFPSSTA